MVRALVWLLFLAAWTVGLLIEIPLDHERFGDRFWIPLAAKAVHLSMYALLASLTGWLQAPVRFRFLLLFVIMAHGGLTEWLQTWIPSRSGTARDVCIDNLGVLLGLLLSWRSWTRPDAAAVVAEESESTELLGHSARNGLSARVSNKT